MNVQVISSVVFFALSVLIFHVHGDGVCSDVIKGPHIVADPDDCTGFFICHSGHVFRFSCASKSGPKKVFDPKSGNCVLQGSPYDHSKCNARLHKTMERCIRGVVMRFPHENCAKYYQCTGGPLPVTMECPYPRLFDVRTQKCEIYLLVKCGFRKEPKDPCDYDSNQCEGSGCVPCRARFGTCIGHRNGVNAWDEKPWTPFFLICKDERVILQGDCREGGQINIFNPFTRLCTPMSQLLRLAAAVKRGQKF